MGRGGGGGGGGTINTELCRFSVSVWNSKSTAMYKTAEIHFETTWCDKERSEHNGYLSIVSKFDNVPHLLMCQTKSTFRYATERTVAYNSQHITVAYNSQPITVAYNSQPITVAYNSQHIAIIKSIKKDTH